MLTGLSRIVTHPAHYGFFGLHDSHMPWSDSVTSRELNGLKSSKTKDSESRLLW